MKTQSITLHAGEVAARTHRLLHGVRRVHSLPCLAVMLLVSAFPAAALVVLTTWATNVPAALPAVQAVIGLSGLVFLALALDADRRTALALSATAVTVFGLAYLGMAVSPEILIVGSMVIATWAGIALFSNVKTRCR